MIVQPFLPPRWARSPHLQTIFGSLGFRIWGRNEMAAIGKEMIIEAESGIRLLGYFSQHKSPSPRGLFILIHGWEGSSDSTYILSTVRFFFRRGYDVFRLNLRDHGNSHHLNRELFHGALTEETARAVEKISGLLPSRPSYLVGFSLGGNFALRIALRQAAFPIQNLRRIFAVSPALDPLQSTLAIDKSLPIYRAYFLAKWKRSLRRKQACFPDLYHFDDILHQKTCMAMTEAIMPWYPEFSDYQDYFKRYTLTGKALASLAFPVTIFVSADDPVVPVEHFHELPPNPYLKVSIQRFGGHCGFLDPFPHGCWYERKIEEILGQGDEG